MVHARAFRWLFAIGVLAGAVPVLAVRHLPMQDYPQHLLFAQVITHLDDPSFDFARNFEVDFRLRPYVGAYGLAWLLHPHVSPDMAMRLGLLVYVLGAPLAVRSYVRALDPDREPASLLGLAAIWSGLYFLGFVNFLVSVPFAFAGLAALIRHRRSGSLSSALAFAAATAGAYLGHVASFAMLLLVGGALALLAAPRRWSALGLVVAAGLLSAAITPREGLELPALAFGYQALGAPALPYDQPRPFLVQSPLVSLLYLLAYVVRDSALWDAALWGLPAGALLMAAWAHRRDPRPAAPRERLVLPVAALVLLFVTPGSTPSIDYVNLKFTTFLYLSLPALVPARLLDRRTLATLGIFAAATWAANLATHLRFDAEASPIDEVIARVPRGARVMPVILRPGSAALLWSAPYTHIGALVQAARGGTGARIFEGPQIPVRLRERGLPVVGDYLTHPEVLPELLERHEPDFLLTRGVAAGPGGLLEGWEPVAAAGSFTLERRAATGDSRRGDAKMGAP